MEGYRILSKNGEKISNREGDPDADLAVETKNFEREL